MFTVSFSVFQRCSTYSMKSLELGDSLSGVFPALLVPPPVTRQVRTLRTTAAWRSDGSISTAGAPAAIAIFR